MATSRDESLREQSPIDYLVPFRVVARESKSPMTRVTTRNEFSPVPVMLYLYGVRGPETPENGG